MESSYTSKPPAIHGWYGLVICYDGEEGPLPYALFWDDKWCWPTGTYSDSLIVLRTKGCFETEDAAKDFVYATEHEWERE